MELATFYLLEWSVTVSDIREQFPVRVEDTLRLAEEANIRHPEMGGYTQIMSTDFVVDFLASSAASLCIWIFWMLIPTQNSQK